MKTACPVCTQDATLQYTEGRDYFVHKGQSDPFDVHFCDRCQLGFSTPFLSDAELAYYYPDNYEAYTAKRAIHGFLQSWKYRQDLKQLRKSAPDTTGPLSVFEIGAGRAEFLSNVKRAGMVVSGVEPSEAGCEWAMSQYDISLTRLFASELTFAEPHDVVVMRHVIEHLNEPIPVLRNVVENGLKPGGLLFLKLPRMDSWPTRTFGKYADCFDFPRHRIHFTRDGLRIMLEDLGFSDIRFYSEVVPSGLIRCVSYYATHGPGGPFGLITRGLAKLPNFLSLGIAQLAGIALSPLGSDRMIVTAYKPR